MGFGKKQEAVRISGDRLASVAGVAVSAPAAVGGDPIQQVKRASVEPDLSRIRKNRIEETPEERKKRLAAKTVNFGATFMARAIIIGVAGYYGYEAYQATNVFPRGIALGIFAMLADFGRVLMKCMEPGSK